MYFVSVPLSGILLLARSFPLGYPEKERSEVDSAVEAFGIEVPLINFQEIPNPCASSVFSPELQAADEDENEDEDDDFETTEYKHHPHVETRQVPPRASQGVLVLR